MPEELGNAVYAIVGVLSIVAGATFCARTVRHRDLLHRPGFLTLLGSGVGLMVTGAGFARYLLATMPVGIERVESCVAVFIGGLVFAGCAIAFFKLHGLLVDRNAAFPGYKIVNVVALLLCAWLGYAFVTEDTHNFDVAALFAMSLLAAALGAHMMTAADHEPHAPAFAIPGARVHARCGVMHRRGILERIELRGDPSHIVPGDDFSTPCWSLRDECGVQRAGAYRRGVEWRYRGRQRYRAMRHPVGAPPVK
ncbi:NAD(P)(+) transhydrogenase (Re/Si-specific) subunit beta [Paraburkholderia sartisoli]|uniref:NAD(P) transhydrogenase subunit beta n=1 Tax=Paraburkholderia sartisoli TaxID=83784 RepID=A0A1H4FHE4_9BURK|nr:NAD(P)(+) transhydrogenase (Re/Si-specific) subunit beta [Paraburkholderia sartisoli]SEA96467.1 NAD(P) transhydrogenase subunit beta [Paraburkholderia sartisoli]